MAYYCFDPSKKEAREALKGLRSARIAAHGLDKALREVNANIVRLEVLQGKHDIKLNYSTRKKLRELIPKYQELAKDYAEQLEKLVALETEVNAWLETVPQSNTREMVRLHYVCGYTWELAGKCTGIEANTDTIRHTVDDAIRRWEKYWNKRKTAQKRTEPAQDATGGAEGGKQ